MDSILQKRLIGAVIVIAAAVVFIPMLLDGPGESGVESVDLGIPEPGPDGMRTEVIPLDPTPPPAPARTESVPPNPAPAMPARPPSVAASPDDNSGSAAVAATSAPDPAASATAPRPALPSTAAPTTSAHQADVSGRWHVNLGSYANQANAARLVSEMQRAGMPAEAESVTYAGQPARSVRVGPYADRVRAEAARLAIAGMRRDLTPSLMQDDSREAEPAPRAPAAASAGENSRRSAAGETTSAPRAPATSDVRGWVVQVGAFSTSADAAIQATKLRDAGFTAFIDRLDAPKGTLHRVRVGPETQRASADRLRASIQSKLGVDGVVMRHP